MEYWAKIGHRVLQFIGPDGRDPIDTGRKLNVHKTSRTSSQRLMYVQFTSCVY